MPDRPASYYRLYRALKVDRQKRSIERAYHQGVEDMRSAIADKFRSVGIGELNGHTAVAIVKMELPPQWVDRNYKSK